MTKTRTSPTHTAGTWFFDGECIRAKDAESCIALLNAGNKQWKDNAAFIVLACNSYEDLLEACKWAMSHIPKNGTAMYEKKYADAIAALAKAEQA